MNAITEREYDAAAEIVEIGRLLSGRGWVPATSGNFSCRIDDERIAITGSGIDKGALAVTDIRVVHLNRPLPPGVSAETPLHTALYRRSSDIGAILHTHSLAATVVSRAYAGKDAIVFQDYELQKGIRGRRTHNEPLHLPLVTNSQDMNALAEDVERQLAALPQTFGYVIAGHGLYAWGNSMAEARRHLEAFEFLLACELELGRYRQ